LEYWKKAAIIGALGYWSDIMDMVGGMAVGGIIAVEWNISPVLMGFAMTLSRAIFLPLHGILSGPLTDLFGRKKLFVIGNFIAGLVYVGLAMATNFWQWVAIGIIGGWMSFLTQTANIFIIEELPAERRGTLFGLTKVISAFGAINATFSLPLFVGLGLPWRTTLWYIGFFDFLVAILGLLFLRESTVWMQRRELIKQGKLKETKLPLKQALSNPEIRKRFILMSWFMAIFNFSRLPDWFSSYYMGTTLHFGPSVLGYVLGAASIVGIAAPPFAGKLSDVIGRVKSAILMTILCVITPFLWYSTDIIVGTGETLMVITYFLITYLIWRFFFIAIYELQMLWQPEVYPTSVRATLSSFNYLAVSAVDIPLPTISGLAALILGPITYPALGTIGLLSIIPLIPLHRLMETKGKPLTAIE